MYVYLYVDVDVHIFSVFRNWNAQRFGHLLGFGAVQVKG